ncbi:uncharacterized protein LOC128956025 [Oppia nitens]|uniref:uncharacterized protein LOC128956025 n=1 Tax=Oppia nitens TaxID=1686743 RepID=UPI0023DCDCC7|nr:uncharacterized protein LOC128956025 [Oppia nitens]
MTFYLIVCIYYLPLFGLIGLSAISCQQQQPPPVDPSSSLRDIDDIIDDYQEDRDLRDHSHQRSNGSRMLPFFQRPSLLNIVRFPNEECFDASNQTGTCYTPLECKKLGGVPSSPCARGLGSCCIVSRSCHNTTYNKVVYFRNPSYPMPDNQQNFCDLNVIVYDTDVCQLRLDFIDFQLDQPTYGNCLGDRFYISASGFAPMSVPVLCGLNRNQHMYVSLPRDGTDRTATIVFDTNSVGDYRWHIRITQIDCNFRNKKNMLSDRNSRQWGGFGTGFGGLGLGSNLQAPYIPFVPRAHPPYSLPAPMGCTQYFTQPMATLESFNFGEYLNNMDYAICIERLPNTCRVIFTASDFQWSIDSTSQQAENSGVGDLVCDQDYVTIPGGSQTGDGDTKDRYCGGRLSYMLSDTNDRPVISKANGPIIIRFHTDGYQRRDTTNKEGFRLRYEQSSTDCMMQFPEVPPTQVVVQQVVAQYLKEDFQRIDLEKQEPIVHLARPETQTHVRSNAKHMKF